MENAQLQQQIVNLESFTAKLKQAQEEGENQLKAGEQAVLNLQAIVAKQKLVLEAFRVEAVESRETSERLQTNLSAA